MLNVNRNYKFFSYSDVKDRSVLKVIQLSNNNNNNNNNKTQVSFKQPESDDIPMYVPFTSRPTLASEITYQRLSRLGRMPSATSVPLASSKNVSIEDKSTPLLSSSSSFNPQISSSNRSLSEPRRRIDNTKDVTSIVNNQTSINSNSIGQ